MNALAPDQRQEIIRRLYDLGLRRRDIAAVVDCSVRFVGKVVEPSRFLTAEDIAEIRRLRYEDGMSCPAVAKIFGVNPRSIHHHAPGRPGKVPVAPLREAFERSPVTAADVARDLGWWDGDDADSNRVKRTLGINYDTNKGRRYRRSLVDAETVRLIAEAIGVSPWSVLPDEDNT